MSDDQHTAELRKAYALGIEPMIATDVTVYGNMTLRELGEEWGADWMEMFAVLAKMHPSCMSAPSDLARKEGEPFSIYMNRLLCK